MPSKLSDDVVSKISNKDWLYDQHVSNVISITELSKILGVTPSVIRNALRKFGIVSPSQQELREASNMRKHGVVNSSQIPGVKEKVIIGNKLAAKEALIKRRQTNQLKYGVDDAMHCATIVEQMKESKLGTTYKLLIDSEWLYEQHYKLNKSLNIISMELGIAWSTVQQKFKDADVPIRQTTIPYDAECKLLDKEWMINQHIVLCKTIKEISEDLNVNTDLIVKYFNQHNISLIKHSGKISSEVRMLVTNSDWLNKQYHINKLSIRQMAEQLNVDPVFIYKYFNKFTIDPKYQFVKMDYNCFDKIHDYNWLYNQHITLQKPLIQIATELGFCETTITNSGFLSKVMKEHGIHVQQYKFSVAEKQILTFLNDQNIDCIPNIKSIISPYELDIYIPSLSLAIDYAGLYWHNSNHKEPNYHIKKLNMCKKLGIRLLTIYEDEWLFSRHIVESKIKSILQIKQNESIHARKCNIVVLDNETKTIFLDKYHIQKSGPGSISYGLIYNDNLIACVTFINKSNGTFILNRFASSCNIPGGFSKLLAHFKKNNDWKEIVTFADLRWSQGDLYFKTGFKLDKILKPDYEYVINNKRVHKFNFRHTQMKKKLSTYDPLLSESENMKIAGIPKIYNCGLMRFITINEDFI